MEKSLYVKLIEYSRLTAENKKIEYINEIIKEKGKTINNFIINNKECILEDIYKYGYYLKKHLILRIK